jgi:Fic family protein
MEHNIKIWKEIEAATEKYKTLGLEEAIDYKKFYIYSLVTHSTAIEGSSLTEEETTLLFDEGLTAKGKPLLDHLMNEDLKNAYIYAMSEANKRTAITPDFFMGLNALIMSQTGGKHEAIGGSFDSSKGKFRKLSVFARGGESYMDYKKVSGAVDILCLELSKVLPDASTLQEKYNISFDAHLNLVTIHPWTDGNGRTSRLLMNYIQFCYGIVPSKVYKEDKADYIEALKQSQKTGNNIPFRNFMAQQHLKLLNDEICNFEQSQKVNNGFKIKF